MFGLRSVSIESVAYRVAQLLAIIVVWSAVLALGMGYFFSPIGTVEHPTTNDLVGFGCAFTTAGAAAASLALLLGGKRWWAAEVVWAVVLILATAAMIAYIAFWLDPMTMRSRMDAWSFLRLQGDVLRWGEAIVYFYAPLGMAVGAAVGMIGGALIVIARRRPRLARWAFLGLLVNCASEPVRPRLCELVSMWEQVGRQQFGAVWPRTPQHVWATAAILGAIAGVLAACLWASVPLRRRSGDAPRVADTTAPHALP